MGSKQIKGLVYVADDGTRYDLTDRQAGFPTVPEPDSAVLLALLDWAATRLRRQVTAEKVAFVYEVPAELAREWARPAESGPLGGREDRGERAAELPRRSRTSTVESLGGRPIDEVPVEILERALDGLTGPAPDATQADYVEAPGPDVPASRGGALERLRRQAGTRARSKLEQGLAEAGQAKEITVELEEAPDTGPGEVLLATDPAAPDKATMYRVRDGVAEEVGTVAFGDGGPNLPPGSPAPWDDGSEVGPEFDSREPLRPPSDLAQRTAQAFPDDEIPF